MHLNDFPHLEFVENVSYEFIINRKYIQVCNQSQSHSDTIQIVIYREDKRIDGTNGNMNLIYISFSLYKEIKYKTNVSKCIYYEVVSKKQEIQNAMELRAVNKIIQNIIGDKYFEYK